MPADGMNVDLTSLGSQDFTPAPAGVFANPRDLSSSLTDANPFDWNALGTGLGAAANLGLGLSNVFGGNNQPYGGLGQTIGGLSGSVQDAIKAYQASTGQAISDYSGATGGLVGGIGGSIDKLKQYASNMESMAGFQSALGEDLAYAGKDALNRGTEIFGRASGVTDLGVSAYNQGQGIINQGSALLSGNLPPGLQAAIDQSTAEQQSLIRSQYGKMGLSGVGITGSTMETQDIANTLAKKFANQALAVQQQQQTGIQAIGAGTGVMGQGTSLLGVGANLASVSGNLSSIGVNALMSDAQARAMAVQSSQAAAGIYTNIANAGINATGTILNAKLNSEGNIVRDYTDLYNSIASEQIAAIKAQDEATSRAMQQFSQSAGSASSGGMGSMLGGIGSIASAATSIIPSVVCTKLYNMKRIDRRTRTTLYRMFLDYSERDVRGYHTWAIPYTKLMDQSKLATDVAYHMFTQIAKQTLLGKVYQKALGALSTTLGVLCSNDKYVRI